MWIFFVCLFVFFFFSWWQMGEKIPSTAYWETLKLSEQIACFLVCEGSKDSEEDEERLPEG